MIQIYIIENILLKRKIEKYGLTNKYSFLKENNFFNKIRDDVSKLKFNNTLRVNFSLKSI